MEAKRISDYNMYN